MLTGSLDYLVRVSDKNHYIAPTRGQLGNGLKTLWAAPFVASGDAGFVEVHTRGAHHRIAVRVDRIAQRPEISHTVTPGSVRNGTVVRVTWPKVACFLDNSDPVDSYNPIGALMLVRYFAACNPHATFRCIAQDSTTTWAATAPTSVKWMPTNPTSAHWYDAHRLADLIGAYVTADRAGGVDRTVREFVGEFRGLTGTLKQKAVLEVSGLARARLSDMVRDGEVDPATVERLLIAMQSASRPVKPDALGMIGEAAIRAWFEATGHGAASTAYRAHRGVTGGGLPYIIEVTFGILDTDEGGRGVVIGLNWSPTLRCPLSELDDLLGENRVDDFDPVTMFVHLACPRLDFTDRGKGHLMLPAESGAALDDAVRRVTRHWKRAKRRVERLSRHDLEAERARETLRIMLFMAAAIEVTPAAYAHASDQGSLPANARQIWYAARPFVLQKTGKSLQKTHSRYFTQVLLPAYQAAHPDETANWDVHYDDRGHLTEPHTGRTIGLGTRAVRAYRDEWTNRRIAEVLLPRLPRSLETCGPTHRFTHALFIEKEGFNALLESARIAERYDMAMLSTKGMSVTAARELVEELSKRGVTIFVVHDFDKSGLEILRSLSRSSHRFRYTTRPRVIDLGVRLADIEAMKLQSEPVKYASTKDPRENLRACGATKQELDFLVRGGSPGRWHGERVEINAMTTRQLLDWLEMKFAAHGVAKVVPDLAALAAAYRRARRLHNMEAALRRVQQAAIDRSVPKGLAARVRRALAADPTCSWDDVIYELASQQESGGSGE